jgi:hypothetical protein
VVAHRALVWHMQPSLTAHVNNGPLRRGGPCRYGGVLRESGILPDFCLTCASTMYLTSGSCHMLGLQLSQHFTEAVLATCES